MRQAANCVVVDDGTQYEDVLIQNFDNTFMIQWGEKSTFSYTHKERNRHCVASIQESIGKSCDPSLHNYWLCDRTWARLCYELAISATFPNDNSVIDVSKSTLPPRFEIKRSSPTKPVAAKRKKPTLPENNEVKTFFMRCSGAIVMEQ
jgi:hypothetical protein